MDFEICKYVCEFEILCMSIIFSSCLKKFYLIATLLSKLHKTDVLNVKIPASYSLNFGTMKNKATWCEICVKPDKGAFKNYIVRRGWVVSWMAYSLYLLCTYKVNDLFGFTSLVHERLVGGLEVQKFVDLFIEWPFFCQIYRVGHMFSSAFIVF